MNELIVIYPITRADGYVTILGIERNGDSWTMDVTLRTDKTLHVTPWEKVIPSAA